MLRVNECKLKLDQPLSDLKEVIRKKLKCKDDFTYTIIRESKDARKDEIVFSYAVDVEIANENRYLRLKDVTLSKTQKYQSYTCENKSQRPTIIGFGPAGIFCALTLAQAGMRPIVYEEEVVLKNVV